MAKLPEGSQNLIPESFEDLRKTCPVAILGIDPKDKTLIIATAAQYYFAHIFAHPGQELGRPINLNWPTNQEEIQAQHQLLFERNVQALIVYLPYSSHGLEAPDKPSTLPNEHPLLQKTKILKTLFFSHPDTKKIVITELLPCDLARSGLKEELISSHPENILLITNPNNYDADDIGHFLAPVDLSRETTAGNLHTVSPEMIAARQAQLGKNE